MPFISMYHPTIPNSTAWVEQEAYRSYWIFNGWLSNDDPYATGTRLTPGTEIDCAPYESDFGPDVTAFTALSTNLRINIPVLQQPVIVEFCGMMASIGASGDWTVGFAPVTGFNVLLLTGGRRLTIPVNGTAGLGMPVFVTARLPAGSTGGDWTVATQRDSGTATGIRAKGNALYEGYVRAVAA